MTHSNHTTIHRAFAELTQVDMQLSQVHAQLAALTPDDAQRTALHAQLAAIYSGRSARLTAYHLAVINQLSAMIGRVEMLEADVAALQQVADGGTKEHVE